MLNSFRAFAFLILILAPGTYSSAQDAQSGPIRIIVPFAPGGHYDIAARRVAQSLAQSMGQTFLVDNKPGANGFVAANAVAQSIPDGRTILLASNSLTINESLPFGGSRISLQDFVPVAFLASYDFVFMVPRQRRSDEISTLGELIETSSRMRRSMSYASPGTGSPQHLAFELFKSITRTDFVHVPYRAGDGARADIIGGQVSMTVDTLVPEIVAAADRGELRALATTGKERSLLLPSVPTVREAGRNRGLEDYEAVLWLGLVAPAKTPVGIVKTLNYEISKLLRRPEIKADWGKDGATLTSMEPEAFSNFLSADTNKWGRLIKNSSQRIIE